jgi:hypothetical protein
VVPTCGTRNPDGMQQTGWGHAKIILVMAKMAKIKSVKIKTQKQSYVVLV